MVHLYPAPSTTVMSKKPIKPKGAFRPDPNRRHPPIDEDVRLPHQARRAGALADALMTGRPPRPIPEPKGRSQPKISLSDTEIDQVLRRWDQGALKATDPDFGKIINLAREGARLIKAQRRGARQPRNQSENVTRRQEATLQAYRELSPKLQKYPTGTKTLDALRPSIIAKLGLRDEDGMISEETIKHDIRELRPLIRLIQRGTMPPSGPKPVQQGISEKTRQEIAAGQRALAKANAGSKPSRNSVQKPETHSD